MPAKPYTWLFFDADGTLFDYDLAEASALAAAFQQFGFAHDQRSAEVYRQINREIWLDFEHGRISAADLRLERFARMFAALQLSADAESFSRCYLEHLGRAADLVPGALETVQALHPRYRLAIITNGLSDVQRPRLAASGIAPYISLVVISEELGVAKPDPQFFAVALERAGSPPAAQVLVIGDSLSSDILGGRNSGLDTCWFNPAGDPPNPRILPTYTIRRLPELLDLLAR